MGDLRTAYQKTDFLAVWDDSTHNFWLLGFFGPKVLKISDATNGRSMLHSKNKGKARVGIFLRFTFIF
jgi:hypothetical protein